MYLLEDKEKNVDIITNSYFISQFFKTFNQNLVGFVDPSVVMFFFKNFSSYKASSVEGKPYHYLLISSVQPTQQSIL